MSTRKAPVSRGLESQPMRMTCRLPGVFDSIAIEAFRKSLPGKIGVLGHLRRPGEQQRIGARADIPRLSLCVPRGQKNHLCTNHKTNSPLSHRALSALSQNQWHETSRNCGQLLASKYEIKDTERVAICFNVVLTLPK